MIIDILKPQSPDTIVSILITVILYSYY